MNILRTLQHLTTTPLVTLSLLIGAATLLASCDESASNNAAKNERHEDLNKKLPRNLAFIRLDGMPEKISRYKGKHIILNVWATWCPPCRKELPSLQRLSEKLGTDNFVVAGVSVDKDNDLVREYLSDTGISFSKYIDIQQQITKGILAVKVLPETIIINRDGVMVKRIAGALEWDSAEARTIIQNALAVTETKMNQLTENR